VFTATIHGSRGTLRTTLMFGPSIGTKERPASDTAGIPIIPPRCPIRQTQGAGAIFPPHGAQRRWNAHVKMLAKAGVRASSKVLAKFYAALGAWLWVLVRA
jgi:hypothetical protein